jgi:hypothetical protein
LPFDATNLFNFIVSTNTRIPMAARGKQNQKRNDLLQIGVAVFCSRTARIPLWHSTYGGNIADPKSFAMAILLIQQRLAPSPNLPLGASCWSPIESNGAQNRSSLLITPKSTLRSHSEQ